LNKNILLLILKFKTSCQLDTVADWTTIPSLEAKPPDVMRYFVRVKSECAGCLYFKEQILME